MNMKRRTELLSAEEEATLLDLWLDEGDISARNKLVTSYKPQAVSAAQRYAARGTIPLEDLCQEAFIAIAVAIDKFDRSKGVRLSTFAAYHLRSNLMRYVMNNAGIVRVGTNFSDKKVFSNLRRMTSEIEARTGKPIDDDGRQEIADQLNVRLVAIKRMEARVFNADVSVPTAEAAQDDDAPAQHVQHENLTSPSHEAEVGAEVDAERLVEFMQDVIESNYSGRDLHIIQERLAGDMNAERYSQLVDCYGITVERIRQIQRQGLATVREALNQRGIMAMHDISLPAA